MVKTKVTVLGCGDMAHSHQTTSSFMVQNIDSRCILLFDCGYNVFPKLLNEYKEQIEFIEDVFISHLHADHVGSLGALIYYRFFIYGKKTRVISDPVVLPQLEQLLKIMVPNVVDLKDMNLRCYNQKCYNLAHGANTFVVDHMGIPACGLVYEAGLNNYIVFTGDTDILNPGNIYIQKAKAIFHDCTINVIPPGVHAYIDDIYDKYPKEIRDKIILVHHGVKDVKYILSMKVAQEGDVFEI